MSEGKDKKRYDFSFYFFKWTIICVMCLLVLGLVTKPLRKRWAEQYFERGDVYLEQKKFESAILEYKKSLFVYWRIDQSQSRIKLAKESSTDVIKLEKFYEQRKLDSQVKLIRKVKANQEDEITAVKFSKELLEDGETQYAVLVAEKATKIDSKYRDAWLYLGIANLKAIKMLELTESSRKHYREQAEKALSKARDLDPEYQPTKDYLKELEKIK